MIVIASAGNDGRDIASGPRYPASYGLSNVIAVAATDQVDRLASWSNYSPTQVTVAAPGTDILTTEMGGGYRKATGTSISVALVSGMVGLIKTVRPWYSPADTKAAIVDSARQVKALNGKVSSGGVVNVKAALDSLQFAEPTPLPGAVPGAVTPGEAAPEGMPNLDAARNMASTNPVAPRRITADTLPLCNEGCGGSVPSPGTTNPQDTDFSTSRTEAINSTGEGGVNLLSRNYNWSIPVLSLPGRSGLNLGLSLVYNSLVWTKQNGAIRFNADRGFPGAGFRLGFPVIQQRYYNAQVGKYAYMMVTPSGSRIELRQVDTSTIYESADGSYIQMTDNGASGATVLTSDGTKMTYGPFVNSEMHCTEVKDRNGNYLTISYNSLGRLTSVIDTLNRTVNFNYDSNNYLTSITQTWAGVTHTWATFSYGTLTIQTNFTGLTVEGPSNGSSIPVLTQVGLHDGSSYNFDYTSWGQVWKISNYAADNHLLSYTSYNLPLNNSTAQVDCPRFTEQREWAQNWNGDADGAAATAEEALIQYSTASDSSWGQVTTPDSTIYKELYATSGWQKGLVTGTETWAGGVKRKWTTILWTQDDTGVSYPVNPRPTENNIYDEASNRRRTAFSYLPTTSFSLLSDIYEYDANATSVLRRTHIDYNLSSTYTSKRIIGLASMRILYDAANQIFSKIEYQYDEGSPYFVNQGTPTRHDSTNYGSTYIAGRGNLTSIIRWNADYPTDTSKAVESNIGYNTAGAVILTRDGSGHQATVSYTDSFSDTSKNSLGTFAYPTTVTDPDGFNATTVYNYDIGAATKTSEPSSGTGTGVTYLDYQMSYDVAGRLTRIDNLGNSAYTRFVYPTSQTLLQQYQTINTADTAGEVYSTKVLDGAGRLIGSSTEHPGSTGLYSGQLFVYDSMGRLIKQSNPTEMTSAWAAAGDDSAAGWKYTQQTFDWNGRPAIITNTDLTTTEFIYGGCGCAGGEVITVKGEQLTEGRRQQKIYKDVLGRVIKTEALNWDGSVYSTVKNTYNIRDQVTNVRQYAGADTSSTYQDTITTYDGHARLATRRVPAASSAKSYSYFGDDTLEKMTDGRGATQTFAYNARHLVTGITYGAPTGSGITVPSAVSFSYDAAGHRTGMTDSSAANRQS